MNTALRLLAAALFAVILSGQTKPKDVEGWGKVKWGMTLAEAKAACGPVCGEGSGVDIGGVKMGVSLSASPPDDKTAKVVLGAFVPANRSESTIYAYLKSTLIRKYGPPASEDTNPDELGVMVRTAMWVFPSTTITLKSRVTRQGFLDLTYEQADKKAADAL